MAIPKLGQTHGRLGSGGLTLGGFAARLLVVVFVGALAATLWQLADVLVLLFGAVLLAIGLCAAARTVSQKTGIRRSFALAGVFVLGLCIFGAALWIFGSTVAGQVDDVALAAPAGFKLVMAWISGNPYGRQLLDQVRGANMVGATGWATSVIAAAAGLVTRTLGYAVIALFMAIYLSAQPERYRQLCLRLVPTAYRPVAEHLFGETGRVLQRWLVGQLVVMATIGLLTGTGLWLMGIEAAFALGLMGGLLCFIPFVGAVLAAVPATLVALTQGPIYAASVICMYAGAHFIEGNFITPMVQAEATWLPPVLALLSTVAFSVLFGPIGALLAAPLTLFLMVAVEVLYVQQGLGKVPEAETANLADGERSVAPVAKGRSPQLRNHWPAWLKTTVQAALVGIPLLGLVGGFAAQLTGHGPAAAWIWGGATLPVLIALLMQIVASMWRGEFGLDIVAALSMSGALVFGEHLAAVVVALMYAGGQYLESFAEGRARREMTKLLSNVPEQRSGIGTGVSRRLAWKCWNLET